jgi:type III restriction enzyme
MVYRLDAVDAYERKLVKQIEVAAATIEDAFNKPYVPAGGAARRASRPRWSCTCRPPPAPSRRC